MALNTEANRVEVLSHPATATTDADNQRDQPNLLSLKWAMGEKWWHRSNYTGALLCNTAAFILPALYRTLVKIWIANIDSSFVVTTDVHTYIGRRRPTVLVNLCSLLYFLSTVSFRRDADAPTIREFFVLPKPGLITLIESAIRNALYLWLVAGVVSMSADYATAWGVFSTIWWALIIVPVQAAEATTLPFVGRAWGQLKRRGDLQRWSWLSLYAFLSVALILMIETPLLIFMSLYVVSPFAFWLSNSCPVAKIVENLWRTIDWTAVRKGTLVVLFRVISSLHCQLHGRSGCNCIMQEGA
ncbi:Putative Podospora anserina S mat genomic DNA chromosome 4, supercontig 1 [Aspergillus calidoustus]|uniref:Putative Podospora anserina S mat genomic DNA chromosome 4, supercontig 1 n=1 Tax=Aspergillus calidoustus TaxID=454130 RepID=A0A0U5G836_ASPCI|nr:Putative Podospora anserina S mat genomic DNA chromosome 4, supercontig 1 [Aspergillus calidoustus]